jgi:hypothetical protein
MACGVTRGLAASADLIRIRKERFKLLLDTLFLLHADQRVGIDPDDLPVERRQAG